MMAQTPINTFFTNVNKCEQLAVPNHNAGATPPRLYSHAYTSREVTKKWYSQNCTCRTGHASPADDGYSLSLYIHSLSTGAHTVGLACTIMHKHWWPMPLGQPGSVL